MAKRFFQGQDEHAIDSCGCSVEMDVVSPSCTTIKCDDYCNRVVRVNKGEAERVKIDFASCGYCVDNCNHCPTWQIYKEPEIKPDALLNCGEITGFIDGTEYVLDEKTGMFFMTFEAYNIDLQNGDRFRVKASIIRPDNTPKYITFHVVIGGPDIG